jgi:hypothetical protein
MTNLARRDLRPDLSGLHDKIIGALPTQRPHWLVEGTLFDNRWVVATADPGKRNREVPLNFDLPIEPARPGIEARLLDHPLREKDLLTVKLYIYWRLQGGGSAKSVYGELYSLMWIIRWRLHIRIQRMSDITNENGLFEDFWLRLKAGGRRGLVDLGTRVEAYVKDIRAGRASVPTYANGPQTKPQSEKLAAHLGIPNLKPLRVEELRGLMEAVTPHVDTLHFRTRLRMGTADPAEPNLTPVNRYDAVGFLSVWANLHALSNRMQHDPLTDNPFRTKTISQLAGTIPIIDGEGRMGTIPSEQACFIVDRALRWVYNYSDDLLQMLGESIGSEPTGCSTRTRQTSTQRCSSAAGQRSHPSRSRAPGRRRSGPKAFARRRGERQTDL